MCTLKTAKMSYFSSVPRSEAFLSLLVSVSGYSSLDTAKAAGAFITEAHSRCSADTYNGMINLINLNDIGPRSLSLACLSHILMYMYAELIT